MTDVTQYPHFIIETSVLAKWIESQKEAWWNVDGDANLMSRLNFPCPSEELAKELGQRKVTILALDVRKNSDADGEKISGEQFAVLANTDNNSGSRTFLLSWSDAPNTQWLLLEDLDAAKDAKEAA